MPIVAGLPLSVGMPRGQCGAKNHGLTANIYSRRANNPVSAPAGIGALCSGFLAPGKKGKEFFREPSRRVSFDRVSTI